MAGGQDQGPAPEGQSLGPPTLARAYGLAMADATRATGPGPGHGGWVRTRDGHDHLGQWEPSGTFRTNEGELVAPGDIVSARFGPPRQGRAVSARAGRARPDEG